MSVMVSVSTGTPGAAAANARYTTCAVAVVEEHDGFTSWGLPEEVTEPEGWTDLRAELISWAGMRQDMEIARHGNRAGKPRTHFRAILSFERDVPTGRALGLVRQWIGEIAPEAVGFATLHRDTDHPHVHVWIDARQQDGYKIQWAPSEYRRLDEAWSKLYSVEMAYRDTVEDGAWLNNRTVERRHKEHLAKKQETQKHKTALAQWHQAGEERGPRPVGPERADRRPTRKEGAGRLKRALEDPLLPPKRNLTDRQARYRWREAWREREMEHLVEERYQEMVEEARIDQERREAERERQRKEEEERRRAQREKRRQEQERQRARLEQKRREAERRRAEQQAEEAQRLAGDALRFTEKVAAWIDPANTEATWLYQCLYADFDVGNVMHLVEDLDAVDEESLRNVACSLLDRYEALGPGQQTLAWKYVLERQPQAPEAFAPLSEREASPGAPPAGMKLLAWMEANSWHLVTLRKDKKRLYEARRQQEKEQADRLIADSLQFRDAVAAWLDLEYANEKTLWERIEALHCVSDREVLAGDPSSSDEDLLQQVSSALYKEYETLGAEQQVRIESELLQEGSLVHGLDRLSEGGESAPTPQATGMKLIRWIGENSDRLTACRADALRQAELKRQQKERERQRAERRKRRAEFERDAHRKRQAEDLCEDIIQFCEAIEEWLDEDRYERKNIEAYIGTLRSIQSPIDRYGLYTDAGILSVTASDLAEKYNQLDELQQEYADARLAQQELSLDSVADVKQRSQELAKARSQIEDQHRYGGYDRSLDIG